MTKGRKRRRSRNRSGPKSDNNQERRRNEEVQKWNKTVWLKFSQLKDWRNFALFFRLFAEITKMKRLYVFFIICLGIFSSSRVSSFNIKLNPLFFVDLTTWNNQSQNNGTIIEIDSIDNIIFYFKMLFLKAIQNMLFSTIHRVILTRMNGSSWFK